MVGRPKESSLLMIGLLLPLILGTSMLVPILSQFDLLNSRSGISEPATHIGAREAGGTLLIDVLFELRSSDIPPLGLLSRYQPISGATIMISRSDIPQAPQIVATTNSTGYLRFTPLPSASYLLTVNDTRFKLAVPVQVFDGKVTSVLIRANRISHPISFWEVDEGETSGWVPTWQRIFLAIPGGIPDSSRVLFLETNVETAQPNSVGTVSRLVVSLVPLFVVTANSRQGTAWLELQPLGELRVKNITSSSLVSYVPSYDVSFA